MAINPDFLVAAVDLSEVFLDKDTGAPLSGGIVSFFEDANRVTQKLVYTIQRNNAILPPTYTYVPLPNPITLNATGQFQDNAGNNIPVYYYPVDANNVLQLYYITVTNSQGTQQFIRQAWPPNESQILPPPAGSSAGISNQISNSQFVNVNFVLPSLTYTFAVAGNVTIPIAPDWNLVSTYSGAGTITVTRNPIAGSSQFPFNPPYTLTITPTGAVTSLQLIQTLPNNPDIFAQTPTNPGYVSTSVLLGPGSTVDISYAPNGGVAPFPFLLLHAINGMAGPQQINATVQLPVGANASTGDTGFVNIVVALPIAVATTLSNIQVVPLTANLANIPYDQRTSNREQDFQFNYYSPLLKYKPIKSYLCGWDFPLNPTQPLGPTNAAFATGANTSNATWDQTVLFQTTNSGPATSRAPSGAMRITATNASRFALIQYLPQQMAREILNNRLSSNLNALTPAAGGLVGTISLWYTTNANVPLLSGNASLVTALDANGHPSAVVAGWLEVPRSNLGNAQFTVANSATTNFNSYGFSGWDLGGVAAVNTATFFAIVVGFAQLPIANTIDVQSISLVPGDIPTIPAPQSLKEVFNDCCFYYQKSFANSVTPQQGLGLASGEYLYPATRAAANPNNGVTVVYPNGTMRSPGATPVIYNPVSVNAQIYDTTAAADCSATILVGVTESHYSITATGAAGTTVGNWLGFHWSADARLGVL